MVSPVKSDIVDGKGTDAIRVPALLLLFVKNKLFADQPEPVAEKVTISLTATCKVVYWIENPVKELTDCLKYPFPTGSPTKLSIVSEIETEVLLSNPK